MKIQINIKSSKVLNQTLLIFNFKYISTSR